MISSRCNACGINLQHTTREHSNHKQSQSALQDTLLDHTRPQTITICTEGHTTRSHSATNNHNLHNEHSQKQLTYAHCSQLYSYSNGVGKFIMVMSLLRFKHTIYINTTQWLGLHAHQHFIHLIQTFHITNQLYKCLKKLFLTIQKQVAVYSVFRAH